MAADMLDALVRRHGLIRDDDGRVTLRATAMDLAVVAELAHTATVLGALDLAEPWTYASDAQGSTRSPMRWSGCVADRLTIEVVGPPRGRGVLMAQLHQIGSP